MKSVFVLLQLTVLFSYCGTPRSTRAGGSNRTTKAMRIDGSLNSSTINTDVEYIAIEGRSEFGVSTSLEGTWILQAMPEVAAGGKSNSNNIASKKALQKANEGKDYEGNAMSDRMKNSTEVRRDSITTKLKDSVTHIETTVYLINKDASPRNKITPPQSSNPIMHIPEPPSLSFYGSNETFSGFTGCNRISGRYTTSGENGIRFQDPAASTRMACIGEYDEEVFLNALKRVTAFRSNNGRLQLMEGNKTILTFVRSKTSK